MDTLIGERIYFKKLDPDGLSSSYVSWMKDTGVVRFLDNPTGDFNEVRLKEFVSKMNASGRDYLFGIFLNKDSRHIGNIKLGNVHSVHRFADLGIIIGAKDCWGRGYATEAVCLLTDYAFGPLRLRKVIAGMLAVNQASYKVFLKAGYREVGRYAKHRLVNGVFVDSIIVEKCADGAVPG
ncbi:MAG: GNAT family protein [Candidatus Omnitrophota bacterium]|nr:GNAT family protein [Candidatus Omnitrophota bacterium]